MSIRPREGLYLPTPCAGLKGGRAVLSHGIPLQRPGRGARSQLLSVLSVDPIPRAGVGLGTVIYKGAVMSLITSSSSLQGACCRDSPARLAGISNDGTQNNENSLKGEYISGNPYFLDNDLHVGHVAN